MSMLPDNIRGEYETLSQHEEHNKNVVGNLVLHNESHTLVFPVKVYWFGPMLFVGTPDTSIRIDQICPTHAEMYQATLGKPTKGVCDFCGSGSSYRVMKRK